MTQTRDVFQAIADPTRRQILNMLAGKPSNVTAIAGHFSNITRQAVSLHIQFLNDCQLITITQKGRDRFCEANLEKLSVVSNWIEDSRKVWLQRFKSLEAFLEKNEKQKRKAPLKKKGNGKRK